MASATNGIDGRLCETPGCGHPAKLQCPTCIKLNLPQCHFCSQDCFKGFWNEHKILHKLAKTADLSIDNTNSYNPWPDFQLTGPLKPYPQTPRRQVPESIFRPDYATDPEGISYEERNSKQAGQIQVLNEEEIAGLKLACKLARECLDEAAKIIDVGVTNDEIDRVVHEAAIERDCYPSPLNYFGFPKSCCTSVNEVICHGIPDLRPLQDGDIVNVDVTVYHRGFHGDLNETFFVGKVDDESKKLVRVTHECLQNAINIVRPGVKYRDIGAVIEKHARANGFSVVRTYCGHGIHRLFHTTPNVPHYAMPWYELALEHAFRYLMGFENKAIGVMQRGHSFTIEPMINAGNYKDVTWPDSWTAVTTDGKRSAQFEQTLLVTDDGCEILTKRRDKNGQPWFMDQM